MKEYLGWSAQHGPTCNDQGVCLLRTFGGLERESCEVRFGVPSGRRFSQADKCTWWMPWHEPAMKDVASCEKLRLGASIL